ncbi:XRE family transcriptional regulator [Periweissella cryptocerci]|uniref:XRE family transcriptional regulator n=1 Tax=Periweissella cryptocerci TaxID=2506420 RepID=A0A4P6YUF1_9LACO|nr:helix-turn-helix transcriptional regulator [Periweissella cryptocerci]QBO36317.1 XRE family transcriptional regulator [Periweissella cryptocerci]
MELAKQIKQGREQLGWSQSKLAEQLHVARQSVSKWENDQTYPDLEKLLEMSDLFGVTVDSMLRSDRTYQEVVVEQSLTNAEHSWINPKDIPSAETEQHVAHYAMIQITLLALILAVLTVLVLLMV